MKIIKSYWNDKNGQILSENMFLQHIESFELSKVYIGLRPIKSFKISIENERMIIRFSLSKSANFKYYANLLNHSICVKNNTAVFLEDANWQDYENQILNAQTLALLN